MAYKSKQSRQYNSTYSGDYLSRVAFPLGGLGAGMICIEGSGALSNFSIRNAPNFNFEPQIFSAICVKGQTNKAKVVEGPVPMWKAFGLPGSANGLGGRAYGLPRFKSTDFTARFPFATLNIYDDRMPLKTRLIAWSPFEPGDSKNVSLPLVALEYSFTNTSDKPLEAVYSFNSNNFMVARGEGIPSVEPTKQGFVLKYKADEEHPHETGEFCVRVDSPDAQVDCQWFRGGWFDPLSIVWKNIEGGACFSKPAYSEGAPSPGATIYVPLSLNPGEEKTVRVMFTWYVPETNIQYGWEPQKEQSCEEGCACQPKEEKKTDYYKPWYSTQFSSAAELADYWEKNYHTLRAASERFSHSLFDSTLPAEVIEAVAANLSIIKSPTMLREKSGRLWNWEGCHDSGSGCCSGSCTHVWNYAQAVPHLFPDLERTLRDTEFHESQDEKGHQQFRSFLPIRPSTHDAHAAADGQLGGIMKVYREWRISGDTDWMQKFWPKVKQSMLYCISAWDPNHEGAIIEPHHNTYDIEFWGPDGMHATFYLGALKASVEMGTVAGDDVTLFAEILEKGLKYLNDKLWDGEYYYQIVRWNDLKTPAPMEDPNYSPEARELLRTEGPKYQYGTGCLSDGVLGAWIAAVCGVSDYIDSDRLTSNLKAIYKYNFKPDLSEHPNPQRPTFALGQEAGLVLCTWPKGGQLSLPFCYSNEVWTGIEYQAASHMLMMGLVEEGLDIVRAVRDRYDGRWRNPFDEYECGHYYARAMASYGLLQGLTGQRYDAVEKTLYLKPTIKGDFRSFISTASGYGTVGVKDGKPFVEVAAGKIELEKIEYTPCE